MDKIYYIYFGFLATNLVCLSLSAHLFCSCCPRGGLHISQSTCACSSESNTNKTFIIQHKTVWSKQRKLFGLKDTLNLLNNKTIVATLIGKLMRVLVEHKSKLPKEAGVIWHSQAQKCGNIIPDDQCCEESDNTRVYRRVAKHTYDSEQKKGTKQCPYESY